MTSRQTTIAVVTALYSGAGRNFGDIELKLYHDAMDDLDDDDALDAARLIVKHVDLGAKFPSPGMVREYVAVVRARRPDDDARSLPEDTGRVIRPEEAAPFIAEARARLRGVPVPSVIEEKQ